LEGVYLAGVMTRVQEGYAITSILDTHSEKVEIDEPVLEVTDVEPGNVGDPGESDDSNRYRAEPKGC
jgi:hypothetical protein